MKKSRYLYAAGICLWFAQATLPIARGQEREAKAPEAKSADKCDAATSKEESSVTEHSIKIGGQTIPYKATASTTLLKNEKGESTGLMYSAAYTRSDVKDLSTRPVAFLYNGGPGSATMGCTWARSGRGGRTLLTAPSRPPRLTNSWTTRKPCSTKRTWFSLTRWARGTATPSAKQRTRIFTVLTRTWKRSRNSLSPI